MTIKEAPSFAQAADLQFRRPAIDRLPQGLRRAARGGARRRRRADRVGGIQLVDPGRPEERHRLAVALQGSLVQGQAVLHPVGGAGTARRLAHAVSPAHGPAGDRRAAVRQARGDRQHGGQQVRRRQADRPGRDRSDQAAARGVRQVHRARQGRSNNKSREQRHVCGRRRHRKHRTSSGQGTERARRKSGLRRSQRRQGQRGARRRHQDRDRRARRPRRAGEGAGRRQSACSSSPATIRNRTCSRST